MTELKIPHRGQPLVAVAQGGSWNLSACSRHRKPGGKVRRLRYVLTVSCCGGLPHSFPPGRVQDKKACTAKSLAAANQNVWKVSSLAKEFECQDDHETY